jgi:hypothetical protein
MSSRDVLVPFSWNCYQPKAAKLCPNSCLRNLHAFCRSDVRQNGRTWSHNTWEVLCSKLCVNKNRNASRNETSMTRFQFILLAYQLYSVQRAAAWLFDVICVKWFCFEVKRSEVSYGEVPGNKSAIFIRVTLYWGYLIVLWLFHLGVSCTVVVLTCTVVFNLYCGCCNLYCGCFNLYCGCFNLYCGCCNLFFNVWVCVCVGFVMCGCV